jgi:hypothetical protein
MIVCLFKYSFPAIYTHQMSSSQPEALTDLVFLALLQCALWQPRHSILLWLRGTHSAEQQLLLCPGYFFEKVRAQDPLSMPWYPHTTVVFTYQTAGAAVPRSHMGRRPAVKGRPGGQGGHGGGDGGGWLALAGLSNTALHSLNCTALHCTALRCAVLHLTALLNCTALLHRRATSWKDDTAVLLYSIALWYNIGVGRNSIWVFMKNSLEG